MLGRTVYKGPYLCCRAIGESASDDWSHAINGNVREGISGYKSTLEFKSSHRANAPCHANEA
jgi:hypothetical protein